MGCLGCVLCQKRLRLSFKVDECKPLAPGALHAMFPTLPRAATPIEVGRCRLTLRNPR
jgi:hypothetical protein